jgi:hypothetical protein
MSDEACARRAGAASSPSFARCVAHSDAGNRDGVVALLAATERARRPTTPEKVVVGCAAVLEPGRSGRYRAVRNTVANGLAPLDCEAEARPSSTIRWFAAVTGTGVPRTPSTAPLRNSCDRGSPARPDHAQRMTTPRGNPGHFAPECGEK